MKQQIDLKFTSNFRPADSRLYTQVQYSVRGGYKGKGTVGCPYLFTVREGEEGGGRRLEP